VGWDQSHKSRVRTQFKPLVEEYEDGCLVHHIHPHSVTLTLVRWISRLGTSMGDNCVRMSRHED
jgi:hypothetical protein